MEDKRNKLFGIAGTLLFHIVLILLLVMSGLTAPLPQEEEGILVVVGDPNAMGEEGEMTKQDPLPVQPEEVPEASEPEPSTPAAESEMVTQESEESLVVDSVDIAKKEKEEAEAKERALREAEEKRKKAEEEERKRKEAAIKNRVNNVFQNASKNKNTGSSTQGEGVQGSPTGNANTGAVTGSAGYGSYDLGGRGIQGGLPMPSFSVNESGIVVVSITVNASGKVTNAIIGQGTTTTSQALRQSAIEAARKALFEQRANTYSQSGTITYRFDSDN